MEFCPFQIPPNVNALRLSGVEWGFWSRIQAGNMKAQAWFSRLSLLNRIESTS
jgi:hypothetical protein